MKVKELKALLEKLSDEKELDPRTAINQIGLKDLIYNSKIKLAFKQTSFSVSNFVTLDDIQYALESNPDIITVEDYVNFLLEDEYLDDTILENAYVSVDV